MRPQALTIAGSDSSGGAGIQADIKTFLALGVYGASVITAITAQNTAEVRDIYPLPAELVVSQLRAVMDDLDIRAAKTGMLPSPELIKTLAEEWERYPQVPLVVDPVLVSTSGFQLAAREALAALKELLLPRAALVTPNWQEMEALAGCRLESEKEWLQAGEELLAAGAKAVLLKGGHRGGSLACDVLLTPEGKREFAAPRLDTKHGHGTGCTLSAAVTAGLAAGCRLEEAVAKAKDYLTAALREALPVGKGAGPVDHGVGLSSKWQIAAEGRPGR